MRRYVRRPCHRKTLDITKPGNWPDLPAVSDIRGNAFDFSAFDRLMPHPVYAAQSWVSVLNPTPATFETVKPLLTEAYSSAVNRWSQRNADFDT